MKRGDAKSSRFLSPSYTGERPGYTAPSSVSAISKSYGQKEIYTYPPANFTAAQHSKKASYETEGRSKNPVVTIQVFLLSCKSSKLKSTILYMN